MKELAREDRIVSCASALLEDPAFSRLDRARRLLVARTRRTRPARPHARIAGALAFACMLAVLGVTLARSWRPALRPAAHEALTFTVEGAPGTPDLPVSRDASTTLHFSDGSEVVLAPRSRARVTALSAAGATVVLEDGTARLDVVHRDPTSFHVAAGPFDVRITGTRFDATWDSVHGVLTVAMREGRVVVTGCGESAEVAGTSTLQRRCTTMDERAVASALPVVVASPRDLPSAPSARRAPAAALPDGARERAAWLREGDAARVFGSVKDRFDDACNEATTPYDLWVLAESARRTSHVPEARHGWSELRRRFPASREAETSAFVLGRLASDAGDLAAARVWFEDAASSGPKELRREALGRAMTTAAATGDRGEAARIAKEYLDAYPDGPYAERARSLSRAGASRP